jgi:hypothetical protein
LACFLNRIVSYYGFLIKIKTGLRHDPFIISQYNPLSPY